MQERGADPIPSESSSGPAPVLAPLLNAAASIEHLDLHSLQIHPAGPVCAAFLENIAQVARHPLESDGCRAQIGTSNDEAKLGCLSIKSPSNACHLILEGHGL